MHHWTRLSRVRQLKLVSSISSLSSWFRAVSVMAANCVAKQLVRVNKHKLLNTELCNLGLISSTNDNADCKQFAGYAHKCRWQFLRVHLYIDTKKTNSWEYTLQQILSNQHGIIAIHRPHSHSGKETVPL